MIIGGINMNTNHLMLKELLKKYGANKLSEVDPSDYEALLQEAEVLAHE